jgi:alkylation response protein AidB-like acyl-CoA dehydrogenase
MSAAICDHQEQSNMIAIHAEPPRLASGPSSAPSDEELLQRFTPIFARIAEDAVQREEIRELPYAAVGWLRDAGFGALRVPQAYGGSGVSIAQLFRLLILLGEAESNLPQIFRAHFGFVEGRLGAKDEASRELWLRRIAEGALFGAAMAERTEATRNTVTLTRDDEGWLLDGEKYYCTGTLYADWIAASSADGDEHVSVAVSTSAPGVTRLDDWDGFGQRLTGSGTTRFERVRLSEENIVRRFTPGGQDRSESYITAFYQQMHLSALAGIARAVLRDGIAFVQGRTRAFGVPGQSSPRQDPLVQRVIGRLSSLAFSAEAIVEGVSAAIERAWLAQQAGEPNSELYVAADIKAYQGQQIVIQQVLEATTLLFEVGGASATSTTRRLDRHWRNARTISSHNPAILREAYLGDYYLNGTIPGSAWAERFAKARAEGKLQPAGDQSETEPLHNQAQHSVEERT